MRTRWSGFAVFLTLILMAEITQATPSTTYWTPATTDIQPFGVLHIGVDNYFTIFKKAGNGGSSLPTDIGLTVGVLPFEKFQMEVGVDLLEPSDYPLFFNAKLGTPENSLFKESPALNLGVFNVGTERNVTNQNIVYGLIGKTIPFLGRVHAGPYVGNSKALVDRNGKKENVGFMIGFDRPLLSAKDKDGKVLYDKLILAADYASGKNSIGGGGVGIYYYITKDISLLTGPVWFNEEAINGRWKWTIQLDINWDLFK